jgi:hypothetical protein
VIEELRVRLALRAALHELWCAECRVSWSSWAGRIAERWHSP